MILAWPAPGLFAQYQPIRFDHCSVRQGLSQGSGYTITHDKDGFIWMGTQNGLNRFDGHEISVFYQGKNGYRGSNHINSLITDSTGNVWIGSTGGLAVLDYGSRRFFQAGEFLRQSTMLDSIHIIKVWLDHQRNIWVLSFSKGVFCIRTNGHIEQYGGSGNVDVRPVDITADKNGNIWLALRQSVNRFTFPDPQFQLESLTGIDDKTDIRAMLIDSEDQLWIGTFDNGIYIYSLSNQLKLVKHLTGNTGDKTGLGSNDVTSLLKDSDNNIWIGTRNAGLKKYLYKTGEIIQVRHDDEVPESLARNFVLSLYEDNKKNIWVGTSGGGFDKHDPEKYSFTLYRHTQHSTNGIGDNMVFAIKRLSPGYLHFGTQSAGLSQWEEKTGKFTRFVKDPSNNNSLVHNTVYDVTKDSTGTLWIATWGGLCSYDPHASPSNQFRRYNNDKQKVARLYSIHKLKNENLLWVSGDDGSYVFDISRKQWIDWPNAKMAEGIGRQTVRDFYEDAQGNIWLGTERNGVVHYDPRSGNIIATPVVAPGTRSVVRSLRADGDSFLRVGADNGWLKLDKQSHKIVEHFNTANGLPDNVVYSMEKDLDGNWWISTNRGLACYLVDKKNFRLYDERDGLQANEFNTNCSYADPSGNLYFGGVNGFNIFDPRRLKTDRFAPDVRFTAVRLFDSTWLSHLSADRVSELKLNYRQNFVSFEFVALDYSFSDNATYYYMMEGLDKTWLSSGPRRFVSYTGLQPGHYTFKVMQQNRDGVFSRNTAVMKIYISPPWWQTWLAYILYAVTAAGLVYALYRRRINQLHKKQAEQIKTMVATQEDERERLSRDLHDDVGTKLSAIRLYVSSLGKKLDEDQLADAKTMASNSARLIDETMTDVRKMLLNLSPQVLDEFGYTTAVEVLVNKINETHMLHFDLVMFGLKEGLPKDHELVLYRITQELINNVLKHSAATKVSLQVGHRDEKIILMMEDNGKGFDVYAHKNGYGLKNLEARTQLLKGHMEIDSQPGKGTCVLIEIPYKLNSHGRL